MERRKDIIIWVDDKEPVPAKYKNCTFIQTYNDIDFKREVEKASNANMGIYIDFDYDLGAGSADGEELVKWLIMKHIKIQRYRIHTKNPFAKKKLESALSLAGFEKF